MGCGEIRAPELQLRCEFDGAPQRSTLTLITQEGGNYKISYCTFLFHLSISLYMSLIEIV